MGTRFSAVSSMLFLFLPGLLPLAANAERIESAENSFGWHVQTDGNVIVVGENRASVNGDINRGRVTVLEREDNGWVQSATLVAGDGDAQDRFGEVVAIDGDTILVGAPYAMTDGLPEAGAVYVFERTDSGWTHTQRLAAARPSTMARFGSDVAIAGDRLIVAAPRDGEEFGEGPGAAYIFERDSNGNWQQAARLDRGVGNYGEVVAIHGDHAATHAGGRVFLYRRDASGWNFEQAVEGGDHSELELENGVLVVSLPTDSIPEMTGPLVGHVFVYEYGDNGWNHTASLESTMPGALDQFGYAVDMRDGIIAITNGYEYNPQIHLFTKNAQGEWTRVYEDTGGRPYIDKSIGVSAETLVQGLPEPFGGQIDVYDMASILPGNAEDDETDDDGSGDGIGNDDGRDTNDDGTGSTDTIDEGNTADGGGDDPGAGGATADGSNAGDSADAGSGNGDNDTGTGTNGAVTDPGDNASGSDGGGGSLGGLALGLSAIAACLRRKRR